MTCPQGYAMLMSGYLLPANSLPAMAPDIVESGNEPECEAAQEARPFPYAEQGLIEALAWLSGDDW